MATFLTGSTGYLGSYLAAELLRREEPLNVLVRAGTDSEAVRKLWKAWQLHLPFAAFREHLDRRVRVFRGDLTEPGLGLPASELEALVRTSTSILHCAASLNRRSERSCMNVNLKGTLSVIRVARAARSHHELRRFSQVSTVSVAGRRSHETVSEDEAVDWSRPDYDAYGRTKKFAEHLVRELLPDVPHTIFRPSIVMGDTRRPETTQFDMVRAFSFLAGLPFLPLRPLDRIDIVPADWVAWAVVELHRKPDPGHDTYHLSAGRRAETYRAITSALATELDRRPPLFLPALERPTRGLVSLLARAGRGGIRRAARLLDVFFPYLVYDTVFDSERAVRELGAEPAPFTSFCVPLLRFARRCGFTYPHEEWPETGPPAPGESASRSGVAS